MIDKWPIIGDGFYMNNHIKNTIEAMATGSGAITGAIKFGAAGFMIGADEEYSLLNTTKKLL